MSSNKKNKQLKSLLRKNEYALEVVEVPENS